MDNEFNDIDQSQKMGADFKKVDISPFPEILTVSQKN